TSTVTTSTTATFIDSLAQRWAASALARLGLLVDPRDLVYVIGGYTYGGFDWSGRTFGLNGATVGGGWEHQIAPSWTLKAEYRYTQFAGKDLPRPAGSAFTQTITELGAGSTTVGATGFTATDRVSGIALHALRLGVAHYFDGGAPAAAAFAMRTKAPL